MRYTRIFNVITILVFGFHKLTADSVEIKNPLQQFFNEQNQKESNGILIQCNDDLKSFNFTSKSEFHVNCSLRRYQLKILQTAYQRTVSFKCLENTTNIYDWLSSISKNTKSLDLSLNCIKMIPVLQNFSVLTILKYKHNNVDYIEENAFSYLTALEVLDLSHNSLTGQSIRADIFRGNGSSIPIKSLNLGYNKIESIGYRTFLNLPKLRELHLSGNPLKSIDVSTSKAIQSIKSLEVLHLANTDLTTIPDDLFNGLKIKALYINKNYFTEVPEQLASLGRTLEFLDINENPIRILNSNSFLGLHSLKEIVAAGMKNLMSVNQETFSRLTSLEQVVLSFNPQLVQVHPYAFSYGSPFSSSLKIVYLNNNNLKHISRYLLPWGQLEKLELSDNPWACDCSLRWMLDLEEKQNTSIIKKSGMKCSFPVWPNISGFDVYGRPIRQFNCFGPSNIYMKYKTDLLLRKTIFIALIAALFSVLCIMVLKFIVNYRRDNRQNDLVTLSASVNDAFKYYRIPNKPMQAT